MHWSSIVDHRATDESIMIWARAHDYVVVTHDRDFSALLAPTRVNSPSVIKVRTQDVMRNALQRMLIYAIKQFNCELEEGALISIDPQCARARALPFE